MRARLRVGVVGVGIAGRARVRALADRDDAVLVAVHRGRYAAQAGVPELTLDALVEASDLVIVSSPDATHPELVRRVLDAGRHVVVEYPLAPTSAEARALFALAAGQGRVLHVEHIEILTPATAWMAAGAAGWRASKLSFDLPGPPAPDGPAHAALQLARVHRVVHALGWPDAVDVREADGARIDADLCWTDGRRARLLLRRGPDLLRHLTWSLDGPGGLREVEDGRATLDGAPAELPTVPLFATDLDAALARVRGERGPYVPDARVAALPDLLVSLGIPGHSDLSVKAP